MIDEPEPPMPHQHVRIARCPVNVCHISVEPNDRRRELSVELLRNWIIHNRPGQIIECEVQTGTRVDQVLDLGVRLRASEIGVEFDKDNLRHRQSQRAADLACHQLRDQSFWPLTRAPEFEHIHSVVIGFNYRWKRSAFAQRGYIPCGSYCSQAHFKFSPLRHEDTKQHKAWIRYSLGEASSLCVLVADSHLRS